MQKINFNEIKEKIFNERSQGRLSSLPDSAMLVDGFFAQPVNMELTNATVIGGPFVPMIMFVDSISGQISLFALKAIFPDIEV